MIAINIQELTLFEIDEIVGGGFWQDVADFCRGVVDGFSGEANTLANK